MPSSTFLKDRANQLVAQDSGSTESTGIALYEQVYSPENNEIVHGVEVFKNYMAILVEKS